MCTVIDYLCEEFIPLGFFPQSTQRSKTATGRNGTLSLLIVFSQWDFSINWQNGLRPKGDDASRSIGMLLETAPDFGLDAKRVVQWVTSFGIPQRTARRNTEQLRASIDAKRDAKILELHKEGLSQREIAEKVFCSKGTVQNAINSEGGQNWPLAENVQNDTPIVSPEEIPTPPDYTAPFLDEEDDDMPPAINPADAMNRTLRRHEEERQAEQKETEGKTEDAIVAPNLIELLSKSIEESGVYERHSKEQVKQALQVIIKSV